MIIKIDKNIRLDEDSAKSYLFIKKYTQINVIIGKVTTFR